MNNKTQCPNCLTVYIITNEQYLKSKGNVRCGTCRTPFHATFLADDQESATKSSRKIEAEPPASADPLVNPKQAEEEPNNSDQNSLPPPTEQVADSVSIPATAPFDDKLVPIEDDQQQEKVSLDSFIADKIELVSEATAFDDFHENLDEEDVDVFAEAELDSFIFETDLPVSELSSEDIAALEAELNSDETIESDSIPNFDFSFKDNLMSELTIEMSDAQEELDEEISSDDDDILEAEEDLNQKPERDSKEYVEDESNQGAMETFSTAPQGVAIEVETVGDASDQEPIRDLFQEEQQQADFYERKDLEQHQLDQELISEVNHLIDNKLLNDDADSVDDIETESSASDDPVEEPYELLLEKPFVIDPPVNKVHRWVYSPILFGLVLVLASVILYQLWLRQALPILEDQRITKIVGPLARPITVKLEEQFDYRLPVRRDLSNLQLVSARTETHPTRASTTLLRVSMVNQAEISQPFPWIELSLTDENGRLVARRALSPDDYLFNNRIDSVLGANELRPITIELLSFPEQAKGYELKLLSN